MHAIRIVPVFLGAAAWLPAAAQADVTADDVVTNMLAPARAFGFEVTAEPVRDGDTVRIDMKDASGHSIFGAIDQTVELG